MGGHFWGQDRSSERGREPSARRCERLLSTVLTHSVFTRPLEVDSSITFISQIRKWRLREVKKFAQSIAASKWSPKSGTDPVFLVLQSEIVLGGFSLGELTGPSMSNDLSQQKDTKQNQQREKAHGVKSGGNRHRAS